MNSMMTRFPQKDENPNVRSNIVTELDVMHKRSRVSQAKQALQKKDNGELADEDKAASRLLVPGS